METGKTNEKNGIKLSWILGLYIVIGLFYIWATPPMEASDEYKHVPVINHIKTTQTLVVLDPENPGKWLQEGAQPPLYYLLATILIQGIDTTDFDDVHRENRHVFVGNPNQIGNKNLLFHDRDTEPFSGTLLLVYVIRLFSLALGVITVVLVYKLGLLLFPKTKLVAILATILTAFNPMYLFVSASVNNDILSILLGALGSIQLVRLWQDVPHPTQKWYRYLFIGIVCGLGALTKLSLFGLLLIAGIIVFVRSITHKNMRILFVGGINILVTTLAIVGWWLWRNYQLYEDVFGLNVFLEVQGYRDNPTIFGVNWLSEIGTFHRTLWGLFGGVNIGSPEWFYWIMNALVAISVVGWLLSKRVQASKKVSLLQRTSGIWIALFFLMTLFGLLVRWTINYPAFQGRLLFPALGGANVLFGAGLIYFFYTISSLMKKQVELDVLRGLNNIIFVFMLGVAIAIPFVYIAPSYAFPDPVSFADSTFAPIRFESVNGEQISLLGYQMAEGQRVASGQDDPIAVTLYWRADTPLTMNYASGVHLLGRDLESVGQVDRFPGWGTWPPSQWEVGEVYEDMYLIWPKRNLNAPTKLQVSVSLFDSSKDADKDTNKLTPIGENGEVLEVVLLGEAKLAASDNQLEQVPDVTIKADFVDYVSLAGYAISEKVEAGQTVDIDLFWRANGTPSLDYTVFVQLLDEDKTYVSGADAPPVNNFYPTRLWEQGETIIDSKSLKIPDDLSAGKYEIIVGMYDPVSGSRMGRLDGSDHVSWIIDIETN